MKIKLICLVCVIITIGIITSLVLRRNDDTNGYTLFLYTPTYFEFNRTISDLMITTQLWLEPEPLPTPEQKLYKLEAARIISPTDLQLALFAHMAFFPFDFNAGQSPRRRNFNPIHYQPFYQFILTNNAHDFDFAEEMNGWHLLQIYDNHLTGFRAVLYSCINENTVIISLRGSDGDIEHALATQSGTWWCNFQSLSGERHSHVAALDAFLNHPDIYKKLSNANIYITGHSLGGYLAYVATYKLEKLNLGENIQRVTAFSAPLFTANTLLFVSTIDRNIRNRMIHFYVPEDILSGFISVNVGDTLPSYGTFELTLQLIRTLQDSRGIEIPSNFYTLLNLLSALESRLSFDMPPHFAELAWRLNGAIGREATMLTNTFRSLILHVPVPQTWHTLRPYTPPTPDPTIREILFGFTQEMVTEIMLDMVQEIFDADAHFMMNFYPYLAKN